MTSGDDPFARVAASCARVSGVARHVTIVDERIASFAAELAGAPVATLDDPARRRHGDDEATAAYVLALDTVNFGSAWFPDLWPRDGATGYFLVAGALEDAGPITAKWLADVDAATVTDLLAQRGNHAVEALMAHMGGALAELGALLMGGYGGSASAFVEEAEHSGARLVTQLHSLSGFRDRACYDGEPVWFDKRAQITVADLSLAFGGEGLGSFSDLERLTLFADDALPHVLRRAGVLVYDDELSALVDDEVELAAGSRHEVEVRAATVTAGSHLCGALRSSAIDVDDRLWRRAQVLPEDPSMRRHRSRTIAY